MEKYKIKEVLWDFEIERLKKQLFSNTTPAKIEEEEIDMSVGCIHGDGACAECGV